MRNFTVMKDPKGYFRPEQIHPIIEVTPYPYNVLNLVAWNTGRRISEIVKSPDVLSSTGIRKIDLDLQNNRINFVTLKRRSNVNSMWVDGIDHNLMKALWKMAEDKDTKQPIFGDITRNSATMRFQRICLKNGIPVIGAKKPHMHHFRHSAIMFMYAKGLKPEEIQLRTGHSDLNSLMYYLRIMEIENLTEKFKELWKEESKWVGTILEKSQNLGERVE